MILLLTSDLMFQSRIGAAVTASGNTMMVARDAESLISRVTEPNAVRLILIDLTLVSLDLATAIPTLKSSFIDSVVLAYGPHVDVERLELADRSGADRVITRGQMDRDLVAIIATAKA